MNYTKTPVWKPIAEILFVGSHNACEWIAVEVPMLNLDGHRDDGYDVGALHLWYYD